MSFLNYIKNNNTYLGIEFGSTRVKAVLISGGFETIAVGTYDWENKLLNGVWTYDLSDVICGLQTSYKNMAAVVKENYGIDLQSVGAIGISAMMHGYLPFDKDGNQLAEFRTWRNTITGEAAEKLTKLFSFNIPERWSIAHLYQAILNKEQHVADISYITTLAGYIHKALTGENVLGIGEASGMFPIDSDNNTYNKKMTDTFDGILKEEGLSYSILDVLPKVLMAGENAGVLTKEGAMLLDPTGNLKPGILLCPPEGDAGTGMVATNSIKVRTGNVSAGTSIFSMIVLEKELKNIYKEIDVVTTPDGYPVAMVHCNTCTSDINEWVDLFYDSLKVFGVSVSKGELFEKLFNEALKGDSDCGGLVAYNYYAGETVTGAKNGCPMFTRKPDSKMSVANFMRTHIYSAVATLKIGMDILKNEDVSVDTILGHGGLFKTPVVGQKFLAGALNIPVATMETAGEGGPWGMAVLAAYAKTKEENEALDAFLDTKVFSNVPKTVVSPDEETVNGYEQFIKRYKECLDAEKILSNVFFKEEK